MATNQGIVISQEFLDAKERRLKELDAISKLRQFYNKKGIVSGRECIEADVDKLDMDLTEEGKIILEMDEEGSATRVKNINLRQVAGEVIGRINKLIAESADNNSIQGKRYLLLNTNHAPFNEFNFLGLPPGKFWADEEGRKKLWVHRIIHALIEKGHLFRLDKADPWGHGYYIQA